MAATCRYVRLRAYGNRGIYIITPQQIDMFKRMSKSHRSAAIRAFIDNDHDKYMFELGQAKSYHSLDITKVKELQEKSIHLWGENIDRHLYYEGRIQALKNVAKILIYE